MTEHQTGLRFDIYERVHLTEEQPEMKELDSIELIPHIQVMAEGDQVLLKGNLWLTGQYMTEQDTESRTLEHYIPVEISLPLNRVNRLEDISVEIENFDIDLLSSRVLNITGVLALRGMDAEASAESNWPHEDEKLFIHEAEEIRAKQGKTDEPLPTDDTFVALDAVTADGKWLKSIEREPIHEGELEWEVDSPILDDATPIALEAQAADDKKEVKVAFGSKGGIGQEQLFLIKNLLKNDEEDMRSAPAFNNERENAAESGREGVRGDELEWKRLFLGKRGGERQFRKVRLCIVQKAETIDGIAERYSINPREILLYNGLSGQQIAEGQVIYIPS